jgi:threonine dehydratase
VEISEAGKARDLLRRHLPVTRLVPSESLALRAGGRVHLKLESELPTGSFKVRGAINAVRSRAAAGGVEGIVTSSTGNHGAAVAFAARGIGKPAVVFMPEHPNPVKRLRIERLGARIIETGRDYDEARSHAAEYARRLAWYFVEDGRDSLLLPGPATIGLEIHEQLPGADLVYVPVGDSTLIRGLASALKHLNPKARVIGVQAAGAAAYYLSWKQGRALSTESCETIADGLAVRCPTDENVQDLRRLVDEMCLVSEEEMLEAIRLLLLEEHVVAEPAGAAATAAFLKAEGGPEERNVVILVTGANVTRDVLSRAIRT